MKRFALLTSIVFILIVTSAYSQSLLDGWVKYDSPQGNYAISLPTTPELLNNQLHSAISDGKYFTTNTGWADVQPGFSLERARNGYVNGLQGTLIEEKRVSIGGYPGYEWRVETKIDGRDQLYWTRSYLVGNRTYLLQFFAAKENFRNQQIIDCANKYFDSFAVVSR